MTRRAKRLTPASVAGVLRDRPEWLARVEALLTVCAAEDSPKVTSPSEAKPVIARLLAGQDVEALACVALDGRGRVIEAAVLTIGSDRFTVVDPPHILRWVLTRKRAARSFVIAHNHPSGDTSPSAADREVTARLSAAARAVGLLFHDHLITDPPAENWYSFRENMDL